MTTRTYPVLPTDLPPAQTPISFVCVRFSGDFEHNILASECVHDPLNQFIVVNNENNLFFPTLCQAMQHGIDQAEHDLIAVVHEDVLLLPGWQSQLEISLAELERADPDWYLAGAIGWGDGKTIGHWSDPFVCRNTFEEQNYREAFALDETILLLRKSGGVTLDLELPSIHNVGRDMARTGRRAKRNTYVVNAPTIHKYKDAQGHLIQEAKDSTKIRSRSSLPYLADKSCSDDYLRRKWRMNPPADQLTMPDMTPQQAALLDRPLILIGRGGGGTRLLSTIASDCGLFIGNKVNESGDCLDMVHWIYRGVFRKYHSTDAWMLSQIVPDLRLAAACMLEEAGWPEHWGFKLPETALILPEISEAFPAARYAAFSRIPENTVLRRSHMTARLDNHIGRCALTVAYDHFGLGRQQILEDDTLIHMAVTTLHQTALINAHMLGLPSGHGLNLSFEDTIASPENVLRSFSEFSGLPILSHRITTTVDQPRSRSKPDIFAQQDVDRVRAAIARLQQQEHSGRQQPPTGQHIPAGQADTRN